MGPSLEVETNRGGPRHAPAVVQVCGSLNDPDHFTLDDHQDRLSLPKCTHRIEPPRAGLPAWADAAQLSAP